MFGVLYAVLLRSLPYPEPSKLVEIGRASSRGVESVTYPDYQRWRDGTRSFSSLGAYFQNTGISRITFKIGDEPEGGKAGFVSASFFEVMGVSPHLGRVFTTSEEQSGEPVAVLSDSFWQRRLAGSEAIGNLKLNINGLSYRVIGVMPPSFAWPAPDLTAWIPITHNKEWTRRAGPVPFIRVIGRLAPAVARNAAEGEVRSIYTAHDATAAITPVRPPLAPDHKRVLYLLAAAVGIVLLIACANIASLNLARGSKRGSEIAVRVALGAGRWRVAVEMFVESLLLATLGAAGGMFLGSTAMDLIIRFRPANIDRIDEAGVSAAVLIFCVAATMLAAILFGLLPAWQLSGRDPIDALRGVARGTSAGLRNIRIRKFLVAGEIALTLILVAGSGVMLRSLAAAQNVELGFDVKGVETFRVLFPDATPTPRRIDYFRTLLDRLNSVAQVSAAGAVNDLFELTAPTNLGFREVEGRPPEPRDTWTPLTWTTVAGNYFQTMKVQLLAGRWFSESDRPGSPLVAIIDESTARRYWPGEDPVGRRFKGQDAHGTNDEWLTVIGVVRNIRRQGVDREPTPHVYEWYRQGWNSLPRDVIFRTAVPIGTEIRGIARALDPTVILSGVKPVEGEIDDQLSTRRFQTVLLSIFAMIAFVLAAIGVYGVVSYSVSLRSREFGIRAALGESQKALRLKVLREAAVTAIAGILPGLCGVVLASYVVRSLVFGVKALDPISIAGASALLAITALMAACVPAIRASRIDPAVALREE